MTNDESNANAQMMPVPAVEDDGSEGVEDNPLFDESLAAAALEEQAAMGGEYHGEYEGEEHEQAAATPAIENQKSKVKNPVSIRALMERVVKESGLEDDLKKADAGEDTGEGKLANVGELINVAAEYDLQKPEGSLVGYLEQVTLISDVDKIKDGGGAVTLMTLHAAKGLEFPFVAMIGMEDGLIPHARAIGFASNPDEMEEERRLAFVGITRAMKQLVVSNARHRMIRGITERTIESQFLSEMPEECFDAIDLTGEDAGLGSVGYRDESSYGRRAQQERRSYESTAQRHEAAANQQGFKNGMLVRHPQLGLGRIEEVTPAGNSSTRVVVRFQGKGRTPLIMPPAKLEKVDG